MSKRSRKTKPIEVTPEPINQQTPDSPTVLIPATIEEAIAELEKMLHPDFIEEARKMTQSQFVSSQHFGLALWMRNNWGLWQKNQLTEQLKSLGVTHPDRMSAFLLIALWHHLQQS